MPTLQACPAVTPELEERVEAFERALAAGEGADLADFLPPAEHASYRDTLGELIRVEVELLWGRRTPRPLETYLARFPLLQSDPALLGAVAFEEYRQRLRAGERVTPEEYRRHFGLDMAYWPAPPASSGESLHTMTQVCDGLAPAASSRPLSGSSHGKGAAPKATLPSAGDVVLRRFRIKETLGKGAFGSVFLAERLDLFDRPVALKFLPGPSVEPAMLAQLIHENVVPIESAERFGSQLVICMPYRGRTTLQHIVESMPQENLGAASTGKMLFSTLLDRSSRSRGHRSNGKDSSGILRPGAELIDPNFRTFSQLDKLAGMSHVEAALRITLGVVSGLAHAHEHNIVHRDLKPANVLLSDDGTPMILDFNLATQIRRDRPLDCIRMGGTFPYMAPEQIQAARDRLDCRDPRSDLYSVGVMLYELLTGSHPFTKGKRLSDDFLDKLLEARQEKLPDPCAKNSAVTHSVADIIHKLLAFYPSRRYQNARELKEDLERELANLPLKFARESSPRARMAKFRRRHPRLTASLAVGLAATLLLLLPAGIITGVQVQNARRLKQTQRAEALVLREESLRGCYDAVTLAYSRGKDSRLLLRSVERAEELAGRYGIDFAAWDERPEITRLDEAERRELIGGLGEAFQVVSEASAQQGRDTHNDELRGQAEHWKKLADSCFGKLGRTPGSLGKPVQPPTGARELPDLAKLDEADLYSLASDLVTQSRHRAALVVLEELTARNPQHFMAWFWKATCCDNLGNDPMAVHAWTTCTALQPGYAVCHYNLGLSRLRVLQYAEAERSFDKAYQLDPAIINALVNRVRCKMMLKDFADAEKDLNELLNQKDSPTVAWFYRSAVRHRLGKTAAAVADEAEGMKREPNDELGYSARGYFRLAADPQGAMLDLDRALAINPRNREAMLNRINALESVGRVREAIAACDSFLRFYPDMLPVHAVRGVFLARLGDAAEAVKESDLCLKAAPPSGFMYYQLGSLYAQLSRHDAKYKAEAVRLLETALATGLDRLDLFRVDADLAPLKGDPTFQKLADFAGTIAADQRKLLLRP